MGIIKAAINSVTGNLADQWLEVIEPAQAQSSDVILRGVQVSTKKGVNKKRDENVISNGSVIHVYPNQMMLLVESGKIVDYSSEEGYYTVYLSSAPSVFNGQLKESVKESFERFKFGGQPSQNQKVYYINLKEITGLTFGTPQPISFFDTRLGTVLFVRAHGRYSLKIVDPILFFNENYQKNSANVNIETLNLQLRDEFLGALQTAIGQMSVDGINLVNLMAQVSSLSKYMSDVLDEEWKSRGLAIDKVGISSLNYDEESQKILRMHSQGTIMSNPNVREGYVQSTIASGINAAASNPAGAGSAFMGMGMGMNVASGFMQGATQNNAMQMQQQQQQQNANAWSCSCGQGGNTGNFCSGCGKAKPAPVSGWKCACGAVNTGKFCSECGKPQPEAASSWKCSCGQENTGKFCAGCGSPKQ